MEEGWRRRGSRCEAHSAQGRRAAFQLLPQCSPRPASWASPGKLLGRQILGPPAGLRIRKFCVWRPVHSSRSPWSPDWVKAAPPLPSDTPLLPSPPRQAPVSQGRMPRRPVLPGAGFGRTVPCSPRSDPRAQLQGTDPFVGSPSCPVSESPGSPRWENELGARTSNRCGVCCLQIHTLHCCQLGFPPGQREIDDRRRAQNPIQEFGTVQRGRQRQIRGACTRGACPRRRPTAGLFMQGPPPSEVPLSPQEKVSEEGIWVQNNACHLHFAVSAEEGWGRGETFE